MKLSSLNLSFFYSIGYFGHWFTFLIACALLYRHYIYFLMFIITFALNKTINIYLKKIIQQNRPNNPIKFLNSDIFSKNYFGMPSGHTQVAFFCLVYSYLVTKKFIPWIMLLLFIGILVIIERYKYRNHTLNQLFAGAFIGSTIAYLSYTFTTFLLRII